MRGPGFFTGLVLLAAAAALAATTQFQARLTGLFPPQLPSVQAVAAAEREAGGQQEVWLVPVDPGANAEGKMDALAEKLRGLPQVAGTGVSQGPPQAMGKALAAHISGLPSERFAQVVEAASAEGAPARLQMSWQDLAGAPDDESIARAVMDPLGLLSLVAGGDTGGAAALPRPVVWVRAAEPLETFDACAEFVERVRGVAAGELGKGAVLATGRPAFVADISTQMRRDMILMISFTVVAVVLLFCWVYRSLRPLGALLLLQAGALVLALAVARLLFPELNVISIGFASILLGLGIDYCLLAYQQTATERLQAPSWKRMRAGIWFSAVTAGSVFGLLAFSSFPGLAQLGVLVLVGLISIAAFATLILPRWATASWGKPSPAWEVRFREAGAWMQSRARGVLVAVLGFWILGMAWGWSGRSGPFLETDLGRLQPRHVEAYRAQALLAPEGGEAATPPSIDPVRQEENRRLWRAGAAGRVSQAMEVAGFDPSQAGLTLGVLKELDHWSAESAELQAVALRLGAWEQLRRELIPEAKREAAWLGCGALAVVLVLAGIALRSWRKLAWVFAGLGLCAGILVWLLLVTRTQLSFLSLLALPLAFGVAVDYVYHVLLALDEYKGDLRETWGELGLPLTLNAATAALGFESPFLSGQPALRDFGLVMTLGVVASYTAGFILLPLAYAALGQRIGERKHYSPTLYRACWFDVARAVSCVLPRPVLRWMGGGIAIAYAGMNSDLCRTVRGNLALIAPERAGRWDAVRVYLNFGKVLGDYFALSDKPVEKAVALIHERQGFENLKCVRDAGRGGIMAAAHMGFFELGGALTIELDFPTVALTLPEPEGALTEWRMDYRKRWGVETLELKEDPFVLLEMRKVLAEGKFLAALFDRPYGTETATVDLPGGPARFAGGLILLALMTRAPIIPAVITSKGSGYAVHAHEPIEVVMRGSREETVRHYLQQITGIFLPYWRKDPHQWFQFIDVRRRSIEERRA
jgi:lauroyl/myristoyl acyltransferase